MGKMILLTGGARSGKSSLAQRMAAARPGPVVVIATAQALDEEMQSRIAAHRSQRPAGWRTLEAPLDVAAAWSAAGLQAGTVLLDCITMLVTNLLMETCPDADHPDEAAAVQRLEAETTALLALIEASPADWILVTNEVGLGLVPPYPLGRLYRDLLGWANQQLAAAADEIYLLVSGIPVPLHPYKPYFK